MALWAAVAGLSLYDWDIMGGKRCFRYTTEMLTRLGRAIQYMG